jgi:hypothetical protein
MEYGKRMGKNKLKRKSETRTKRCVARRVESEFGFGFSLLVLFVCLVYWRRPKATARANTKATKDDLATLPAHTYWMLEPLAQPRVPETVMHPELLHDVSLLGQFFSV